MEMISARKMLMSSLLLPALAWGCSTEHAPSASGELFDTQSDPLSAKDLSTWSPWTNSCTTATTINVCFKAVPIPQVGLTPRVPAPDAPQAANATALTMSTLATGWQASSNITFVNKGTCAGTIGSDDIFVSTAPDNWLKVQFIAAPGGGNCGYGIGATCTFGITGGDNESRYSTLHEVGHALGMQHEHQRTDVAACAVSQFAISVAHAVLDGTPAPANCTCGPAPNHTPSLPTNVGCAAKCYLFGSSQEARFANANQNLSDGAPDPTIVPLTLPDPGTSVMDYCAPRPPELTAFDRLGIEMMYPKDFTRQITVDGGILNADGSRAVVRSQQSLRLGNDWVARGAMESAFSNVIWGAQTVFSNALTATYATSASQQIGMTLNDVRGCIHSSITFLEVNDALHTAILRSIQLVTD